MEEAKDEYEQPRQDLECSERAGVHVSWDERIIAEHDELRGTRQKINEPSTPYHYSTGDDIDMSCSSNNSQSGSFSSTGVKADWDEIDFYAGSYNRSVACSASGSVSEHKRSVDSMKIGIGGKEQSKQLMQEIQMRLPTSKALRKERTSRWGGEEVEEVGHSGTNSRAKADFKKKRTAHYNEFQKMKEWRANQGSGSTDDDDDLDSDSAISDL